MNETLTDIFILKPNPKVSDLVVRVGVVGDSKDGDDVVFLQQADQHGDGGVILLDVLCVFACGVQVAELIVARQDPRQHVGAIVLVVEGRLGGEHEEMCAVWAPANIVLKETDQSHESHKIVSRMRVCRHMLEEDTPLRTILFGTLNFLQFPRFLKIP